MIPFNYKPPDFGKKFYTDKWGKFVKAWKWHNKKGEWLFCTVRYESSEGKNIIPFHYENDKWKSGQPLSDGRPLLNIHKIINSKKEILLVEGEKCYDQAVENLKKEFDITTWCGGTAGITKTDWKSLENRIIYYWYDNDEPGRKTIEFLKNKLKKLIIVHPPADKPKTWDIADAFMIDEWTAEDTFLYIKQFTEIEKEKSEKKKESNIEFFGKGFYIDNIKWPFKILGPNAGYLWFLHGETGQIYKIKQGSLSNNHLNYLAPLDFWLNMFGYETAKRGKIIAWQKAIDKLNRDCNLYPPFDHNKIRGRGIWQDGDSLAIYTGKQLITGDKKTDIREYSPNGHIYERTIELKLNIKRLEINNFEIEMIKECINKLSIVSDFEKICFLGWCLLAPFCGALDWRPHLWATGPSGTGKSYIIDHIVLPLLGDFKFDPEGGSSGAGIFQGLKNDCFPVVHDEVDKKREDLMQELEFARSASSSKKFMYKGTADQTGKRYQYNSMFFLSSVNHILEKKSDKSRFTIINMTKNLKYKWEDFKQEILKTFSDNICEKVRSLFFYNWKVIKDNINNFKNHCGLYLGDQRKGDQIGTLFAATFSLWKLKVYNKNEIQNICEKYITNYTEDNDMTDELELLIKIFTTKIRYIDYDNHAEDTTLLNLLKRAAGELSENTPDPRARHELFKYGINYDHTKNVVCIAYKYEWLKVMLMSTSWFNNYGDVLKRLNFAENKTKVCYFGSYYTGRAVVLKADNVLRLSDDKIFMEAGF